MAAELRIVPRGGDADRIARRLQAAADGGLQRELQARLEEFGPQLEDEAKRSAAASLPRRGGLAARVARATYRTTAQITGRAVRLRLQISTKGGQALDLQALDDGTIRHPVWGRAPYVSQEIRAGVFRRPFRKKAPDARQVIVAAMDAVIGEKK